MVWGFNFFYFRSILLKWRAVLYEDARMYGTIERNRQSNAMEQIWSKKDDSVLRVAKQPEKYFLQFSQTIYRVLMFTFCLLDKHKHKRACSLRLVKYQNQTTCTEYCCKHRNWQLKLLLFKEKLNLNDVSPTECLSAASRAAAKSLLGWCHESPQVKGHHVTCVIAAFRALFRAKLLLIVKCSSW